MDKDKELVYWERLNDEFDDEVKHDIYCDYVVLLHSIAKSICYDQSDYDDIFQECVLGCMEAIDRWDIKKGPLTGLVWVYSWGYGMNYANRRRHIVTKQEYIEVYDEDSDTYVECENFVTKSHEDEIMLRGVVETLFDSMSDIERKIFQMRYYDDMTAKEIGSILGKTATNIDTIAWQCKKRMRDQFDKKMLGI